MKTKLFLLAFLIGSIFGLQAQNPVNKHWLDINVINNKYSGDYGNSIIDMKNNYLGGSFTLNSYLNRYFNLATNLSFGEYGYNAYDDLNAFSGRKLDFSLSGVYKLNNKLTTYNRKGLSPFVSFGIGVAKYFENPYFVKIYDNALIITKGVDLIFPIGFGFTYQLGKNVGLKYSFTYNITNSDIRDENRGGASIYHGYLEKQDDAYGKHSFGLTFSLGKNKDEDNDFVADKFDLCSGTPEGTPVNKDGCAIDSDNDGVEDLLDKCNDTPIFCKNVDESGCPVDSDKDGVPDCLDKCNNTPEKVTVDLNGCPEDTDLDGVPDYLDICNDTPPGTKVDYQGCTVGDSDADGVPDNVDICPCTPENIPVTANGCPIDTDCDGVADYQDKCPAEKGVSPDGCPAMMSANRPAFEDDSKMTLNVNGKTLEVEFVRISQDGSSPKITKKADQDADDAVSYLQQFKVVRVKSGNNKYKLNIDEINKKLTESENSRAYLLILKEVDNAGE